MKKVAHATKESGTLVGGVASHLNHPLGGGMFGQTSEADAARFQMNEEQDVVGGETSPGEHFDGEEVGTCQDGHVGGNEILPGGRIPNELEIELTFEVRVIFNSSAELAAQADG